MKFLLTILLAFLPVDAPEPPVQKVVEVIVDTIEINRVGDSLVQHIYWDVGTARSDSNGAPMRVLINRGWRLVKDEWDGIAVGKVSVDEFEKCGVHYRIRAAVLVTSATTYDVEVANRKHYWPIVP